jgi:hypothetical protein
MALPPIPQAPPATSSMVTQVAGRIGSPAVLTMAAVSFSIMDSFSPASKMPR